MWVLSCRGEKKKRQPLHCNCAGETGAWGLLGGDSEERSSPALWWEQEEHAVILLFTLTWTRVHSGF